MVTLGKVSNQKICKGMMGPLGGRQAFVDSSAATARDDGLSWTQ